jgi:hypothetical protein
MSQRRPLFVPDVLGTPRQGRLSEHAATLMHARVGLRDDVATQLIDIAKLGSPSTMQARAQRTNSRRDEFTATRSPNPPSQPLNRQRAHRLRLVP